MRKDSLILIYGAWCAISICQKYIPNVTYFKSSFCDSRTWKPLQVDVLSDLSFIVLCYFKATSFFGEPRSFYWTTLMWFDRQIIVFDNIRVRGVVYAVFTGICCLRLANVKFLLLGSHDSKIHKINRSTEGECLQSLISIYTKRILLKGTNTFHVVTFTPSLWVVFSIFPFNSKDYAFAFFSSWVDRTPC